MKSPLRVAVVLVVLLAVGLGAFFLLRSGHSRTKLQLNWKPEAQFGGFYAAALDGGPFKAAGLDVEVVPGGVGTPTVQMVGAGQVDFAVVSADEVVVARAAGNDVVALLAVYQDCPQGLMTRADRGFNAIGDVFANPGTVAMQEGLPYAQLLKVKYGFDKVKVVPSPGGNIAQFLADPAFTQQCFVTSEPLNAKQAGVATKTFLVKEVGYNPYTVVLVTRGDLVRKDPAKVKAVTEAVRQGWEAYLKDPKPANDAMQKLNPGMDAAMLAEQAEAQKPLIVTGDAANAPDKVGTMTAARWEELAKQLLELKVVNKAVPAAECFVDVKKL